MVVIVVSVTGTVTTVSVFPVACDWEVIIVVVVDCNKFWVSFWPNIETWSARWEISLLACSCASTKACNFAALVWSLITSISRLASAKIACCWTCKSRSKSAKVLALTASNASTAFCNWSLYSFSIIKWRRVASTNNSSCWRWVFSRTLAIDFCAYYKKKEEIEGKINEKKMQLLVHLWQLHVLENIDQLVHVLYLIVIINYWYQFCY